MLDLIFIKKNTKQGRGGGVTHESSLTILSFKYKVFFWKNCTS